MASIRRRKILRDVWLHKARTALVVLAIAIGLVGAGAVLNTWALLRRATTEGYRATEPASATLRTEAIDTVLLSRVRALPAIGIAEARRTVVGRALVGASWRTAMLFAAERFDAVRIGKIQPVTGAWPPDTGLVIEASSVEFAEAAIGQPMMLQLGDESHQALTVEGIARDAGLAPGWMEHVVYGFVTPATLERLGMSSSLDLLQIVVRDRSLDREAVRRVAWEVKELVEASGRTVGDIEVPEPGEHVHAGQMNSLLFTQGAFGIMALVLSGFLVFNLISAMLAGQVREIGVMKTLGASPRQLSMMYLGLALGLGLVACLIALPVAAFLGRAYAGFSAELLNFDLSGFAIPRWALAAQLVAGVLLPVGAAALPVRKGCRIPVTAALRDFGIETAGGGDHPWLRRIGGVARPLLFSLRNAFRKRQRMMLTLLTLALGGAVYLGALNLRVAIRNSVGYIYGELMRYDISIGFRRSYPADSLERAVAGIEGVEHAEAWTGYRAAVTRAGGVLGNGFGLGAIPPGTEMVAFPMEQGRWLTDADSNGLVVNRHLLAQDPTLEVGREVSLVIDGRLSRWVVVGIFPSGPGAAAFATRAAVARATGNQGMDRVVLTSTGRTPEVQGELSRRLRDRLQAAGFEVGASQLLAESRRVLEDHLLMVAGFLRLMALAMILVGGLGLASTMSLAVLERTREIGVLRAIGARHHSILGMVQAEGLVIALLSWMLAVPLSIPMTLLLGKVFGRIMMPVRQTTLLPETGSMLTWLGVVVVVSLIACAWPAWRATRVTTAAALAYE